MTETSVLQCYDSEIVLRLIRTAFCLCKVSTLDVPCVFLFVYNNS